MVKSYCTNLIMLTSIFLGVRNFRIFTDFCCQEDDDLSKWKRYWCVLKNLQLSCWSSPEDVEVTQPLVNIPITKVNVLNDNNTCYQYIGCIGHITLSLRR